MFLIDYALPLAAALLLILFFSGLPALKTCALPAPQSRQTTRMGRIDWLLALLITGVYALTAFWNLGDKTAPQTFVSMAAQTVEVELPEATPLGDMWIYPGVGQGSYAIDFSADGAQWEHALDFQQGHVEVLKWTRLQPEIVSAPARIRIACTAGSPWLGELVLLDEAGRVVPLRCTAPALCDEADTLPAEESFMNSTYFDEIYHARTAWEHLHGIWPYEISHPPLGKLIIALGIRLFGMTPFGWRFMGTLFGVLMLPVMYLFLKKLFGGCAVPALGTLVFASDFMHYVQTRIATIDTYGVFFILLMYLCMYVYWERESLPALALSGLFFGLGAASKWTCIYAGGGLAVLWALHWAFQLHSHREEDLRTLAAAFGKNVLFCLLFFVAVPCLIYYLSYLPYGQAEGAPLFSRAYTKLVLDNQRFMFSYHVGVTAEHPYSSRWYQWLLDIRPILYYLHYFEDGTRSSICAFVNPALCWGGLLSLFVLLFMALARRDRRAGFLLIGFLAQLLPWIFIRRLTFAYHYFPSSVFLVLALGYVFTLMRDSTPRWHLYVGAFALGSVALFLLFFPALSGLPVDNELAGICMGWLPTWPLMRLL